MGRRPRFAHTVRRKTGWEDGPTGAVALAATGSAIFPLSQQSVQDGITVVRIHGELLATIATVSSSLDGYVCGFGMCIVSENAAGVGITAVPTPITDQAWDGWLLHRLFTVKSNTGTIADGVNAFSATARLELDSKAMRKFKLSDVLMGVVEVTEVGNSTLNLDLLSRMLIKLP